MTVVGKPWVLEVEDRRATFDLEHGGRLASLVIAGYELLPVEGKDIYHWGSFVLAPWTGRMRDGRFSHAGRDYRLPPRSANAIHGLVVDVPWRATGPDTLGVNCATPGHGEGGSSRRSVSRRTVWFRA